MATNLDHFTGKEKAPALRPGPEAAGTGELLAQSGIEHMREPDTGFLQLLPDDWGVHHDIGRVDVYFARWVIAGRTLSNAVFSSRLFRDSEGLVGPVHRLRMGPAINSGWRDRFHKLSRGLIHVFAHCLEHKAGIPGGMKVAPAFASHGYVVATFVILEGDMKRLMDIAHPMSKELQRR